MSTWDAENYETIAQDGYSVVGKDRGKIAFFPLLPFIARFLGGPQHAKLAGILVSQLCLLAIVVLLSKFAPAAEDEKDLRVPTPLRRQPGFWLLVSPLGFFFSLFYTESLFLLLSLITFQAYLCRKFRTASTAGFLAGLTRPTALFLPALFIEDMYRKRGRSGERAKVALCAATPLLGVLLYLAFVAYLAGDPFAYIHIQREVFGKYGTGQLSLPFSGDFGEFQTIVSYAQNGLIPPADIPVSLLSTFLIITILVANWRTCEPEFRWYVIGGILFIHSMAPPMSSARYELALFPIFILISRFMAERPRLAAFSVAISVALQAMLFQKHATWEFVA